MQQHEHFCVVKINEKNDQSKATSEETLTLLYLIELLVNNYNVQTKQFHAHIKHFAADNNANRKIRKYCVRIVNQVNEKIEYYLHRGVYTYMVNNKCNWLLGRVVYVDNECYNAFSNIFDDMKNYLLKAVNRMLLVASMVLDGTHVEYGADFKSLKYLDSDDKIEAEIAKILDRVNCAYSVDDIVLE